MLPGAIWRLICINFSTGPFSDGCQASRPINESQEGKKGADKGIDGWLTFRETDNLNVKRIVVQVKGGTHIGAQVVRDLIGTVQSTKSAMDILITLCEPIEQ